MAYLLVLLVVAAAFYVISAPLRSARRTREGDRHAMEIAELEAARDAKYREIHDAELDRRTGKLSDDDHLAIDGSLRAEAVEILHRLDSAQESYPQAAPDRVPSEP